MEKNLFRSKFNPKEIYLTEGGLETEMMYKWGFDLPEFAMFPLMDDIKAVRRLRCIFRRYLDVSSLYGIGALMGGMDYRASPDWGKRLGYSQQSLKDANIACIEFLKDLADEYDADVPDALIQGYIGPRGDAYRSGGPISADEAEDYHSTQLLTLKEAGVDVATAATFYSVPEAVGVARAAEKIGVPLLISLTLDTGSKLRSGPTLENAILEIDRQTSSYPEFYMLNCSHPLEYEPAIEKAGDWINRVKGTRPNASKMEKLALCSLGHLEEGNPEELGIEVGHLAARFPHMNVWGGCCGTGHSHLHEIVKGVLSSRHGSASRTALHKIKEVV